MSQLGSVGTKLALVCDQESGVQGRRGDVHPRSIHGIIQSITEAGHQRSTGGKPGAVVASGENKSEPGWADNTSMERSQQDKQEGLNL